MRWVQNSTLVSTIVEPFASTTGTSEHWREHRGQPLLSVHAVDCSPLRLKTGQDLAPTDGGVRLRGVPHELVFTRCAVIVHHGGAGTTAAAVRAGRPQVICQFVADQPFWCRRMRHLGVAPEPIDQRQLTPERLAAAITQALDPRIAAAARRLGEQVRAENGVVNAADALERTALQGAR